MINPRNLEIKNYDYNLPEERIAKYPLEQRDQSKLLVWKGEIEEHHFCDLPSQIPAGSMIVFNNTKVIQARLHFRKPTGGIVEVFCLEPESPKDYQQNFASETECTWTCLVGNSKKWKDGPLSLSVTMPDGQSVTLYCERAGSLGPSQLIHFYWKQPEGGTAVSFAQLLDAMGELPIPPYLNRETQESDKTTYQTVYSKVKGSVAAPTAGLHFTERVLQALDEAGIDREELTLHVGAGTFKPVKSEEIGGHDMHTEHIAVRRQTIEKLIAHGGEAIAVGTTSVRTLESLYYMGILAMQGKEDLHVPQWMPYEEKTTADGQQSTEIAQRVGWSTVNCLQALLAYMDQHHLDVLHSSTQIIIAPGYEYHIVRRMVTNFHQPQSTLLLLVSAFLKGDWRKVYDYALSHDFRFLSYGDSSLLIP